MDAEGKGAELLFMSSVDAYKIEQEKGNFPGAVVVWKYHPKWRHVKHYVDPKWKCAYCGFLGFGHTTFHSWRQESMEVDNVATLSWKPSAPGIDIQPGH